MGCCGRDREKGPVSEEQKWSYLNLDDFKSRSCVTPFSYTWLWILIIIAVFVLAADTFTAVQLLAFNRWASEIKPAIPFEVSKWIFAICIIISAVLLMFEWLRAIRVIRNDGVADSYLDPIAVMAQSIRPGKAKGWKRFLVFAELTRSKKGTDYIAIFVYFQFKTAIRVILAEGPRQVVNAFTLYSVLKLDNLLPNGKNNPNSGSNDPKSQDSDLSQLWENIKILAATDYKQAVILSSMLFTLTIWIISAILLITAVILYFVFLWHYIPSADGTLSRYCRRKVDGRLAGIVSKTTRKALEKKEARRRKAERKALKNGETLTKPTLPDFDDKASIISTDTFTSRTTLARTETSFTTTSTPTLARAPTLPDVSPMTGRPVPSRTTTQSSGRSYASNAPLLSNSSSVGYVNASTPSLPMPSSEHSYFPSSPLDYRSAPPSRSMTGSTQRSFGPGPSPGHGYNPLDGNAAQARPSIRPPIAQSRGTPSPAPSSLRRMDTFETINSNLSRPGLGSPTPLGPLGPFQRPAGPSYEMSPVRTSLLSSSSGPDDFQRPATRNGGTPGPQGLPGSPATGLARPPPRPLAGSAGTAPPALSSPNGGNGGYVAFNPALHSASSTPAPGRQPTRNFSSPVNGPPRANTPQGFLQQPQRSLTSPMMPQLEDAPAGRSATAGLPSRPDMGNGMGGSF